ncbi:hypothetical protein TNCV_93481 [Trichonephila clavipes]|nr:hypothetical protein TNCV_93481 [Trichonephila clavipes]
MRTMISLRWFNPISQTSELTSHSAELVTVVAFVELRHPVLEPQKIHRIEGVMNVKTVDVQSPQIAMVWEFGEWKTYLMCSSPFDPDGKLRSLS